MSPTPTGTKTDGVLAFTRTFIQPIEEVWTWVSVDSLSRQDGWHMRMQQLARAAALSSSAATRLVNRLEDRGLLTRILCADDRRGIYTELTPAGRRLLAKAKPTHDATLEAALAEAEQTPELAPLVASLHALPAMVPAAV